MVACVMWMAGDTVKKCGTPSAPAAPTCFDSAGRERFLFLLLTTLRDAESSGIAGVDCDKKKMLNRRRFSIVKTVHEDLNTLILHIQAKKKKTSLLNSRPLVFPAERFSQSVGVTDYVQHVDVYFTFNLTYRKKSIYTCSLKHLHQHILSQPSE